MKVREHATDPIFVNLWHGAGSPRKIELRIGEDTAGETRAAVLTPREAQRIAVALLMQAEASLEGKTQMH